MSPSRGAEHIRDVNVRYHDATAESYDSKWGIDYGEIGGRQVLGKLEKALGCPPPRCRRALEIGAGTGYFTLNLLRRGVIEQATAIDISAGMLEQLARSAKRLRLDVEAVQTSAEELPFEDGSFDLVHGHAVLHHLPGPDDALREFHRVLAPGGTLAFMGEPSRHGNRLAVVPKRLGTLAAPAWRRLVGTETDVDGRPGDGESHPPSAREPPAAERDLEWEVDVHVFDPADLAALVRDAGFTDVRVTGEELLASAYGWILRSLQGGTEPERVPATWHRFAFFSYLALQWIDGRLLEPRLPPALFYNLLVSARKPD